MRLSALIKNLLLTKREKSHGWQGWGDGGLIQGAPLGNDRGVRACEGPPRELCQHRPRGRGAQCNRLVILEPPPPEY